MTPHREPLKTEVGVRELHDRLSRDVQHVQDGGKVVVTMRGRRVARLVPVDEVDPLADLRTRGLIGSRRRLAARAHDEHGSTPASRCPISSRINGADRYVGARQADLRRPGSELAVGLWDGADVLVSSQLVYSEARAALAAAARGARIGKPAHRTRSPRSRISTPSCAPSRSTNH
jgi:prevent-host-death family protein